MLLQNEILQCAEKEGVPPDTIDKDWVLGHFLSVLFQQNWAQEKLVFKGGTCLKKMQYKQIQFSNHESFFEENRLINMKKEWNNSLKFHIREGKLTDVDEVINELKNVCKQIKWD